MLNPNLIKKFNNNMKNINNEVISILPDLREIDKLIIVNIGTPRADFDSVGPITGSFLELLLENNEHLKDIIDIYGTIDDPIHAKNLKEKFEIINFYKEKSNVYILAIDGSASYNNDRLYSCVSSLEPIFPGKGADKNLGYIGDSSIRIVTCIKNAIDYTYQCSYEDSCYLAKNIAKLLINAINIKYEYEIKGEKLNA